MSFVVVRCYCRLFVGVGRLWLSCVAVDGCCVLFGVVCGLLSLLLLVAGVVCWCLFVVVVVWSLLFVHNVVDCCWLLLVVVIVVAGVCCCRCLLYVGDDW